ncbi:MAG TPA: ABC-2 family transporter protein [Candidatus Saccharimonadales bacterium]|nr:ABC-2 family transporter protein [Candidatus Saccharimonadales bacterium]
MIKSYIKIWWKLTLATTQISLQSRFGTFIFLIGKIMRFSFFLFFLIVLVTKTKAIAGYSIWEIVLFYATFNLLDSLPQFFFRNVYRFREQVLNGYFDNLLLKPLPSLFHPLFGGSDALDLIILFASIFFIFYAGLHIKNISAINIFSYILLVSNGFLISAGFHIFVLASGILTTAVDNVVLVYRDITQMGRLPVEVYQEPLRGIITFVVPVGIMMTFPVKAMLGLLSWQTMSFSLFVGLTLLFVSIKFWNNSLKHYTSASS